MGEGGFRALKELYVGYGGAMAQKSPIWGTGGTPPYGTPMWDLGGGPYPKGPPCGMGGGGGCTPKGPHVGCWRDSALWDPYVRCGGGGSVPQRTPLWDMGEGVP